MGDWCGRNRSDRDCRDWSRNRSSWDERRYHDWYGRNRNDFRSNDGAAAIFGFAAGALTGAIISGGANVGSGNTAACAARYRSYDARTNTFLGYDGMRHACRL